MQKDELRLVETKSTLIIINKEKKHVFCCSVIALGCLQLSTGIHNRKWRASTPTSNQSSSLIVNFTHICALAWTASNRVQPTWPWSGDWSTSTPWAQRTAADTWWQCLPLQLESHPCTNSLLLTQVQTYLYIYIEYILTSSIPLLVIIGNAIT